MKLSEVKTGKLFKVGGIDFIKFSCDGDKTIAVAKECVFDSEFGSNNDFTKSFILQRLKDEILPKLEAAVGAENILEHEVDLTSLDGLKTYILKCDISKFFYNISHEQLKDIVDFYFGKDPDICWLCNLFIDSTEGKGIPLGNQINQGFALLYLDGMDKLIKGELGIEFYGRYMDDFYLMHPDKQYLRYCLEVIAEFLKTLDLSLNGKTQIFPFKNGVSFLGFHTYITATGKVIRKLKNQNKRNAQRKYIKMAKLVADGKMPIEKFNASYNAWKNHISHGNCYNLAKVMDERVNHILGGYDMEKRLPQLFEKD